jgi:glycosyltransferase involved in cell wall biosynthesis
MRTKGISIVICCHNSEKVIKPTLESIHKQFLLDKLNYQIILVDNNCTDNTIELAQKISDKERIYIDIVRESIPGLVHARKAGVKEARNSILLFVDDDNVLRSDYISRLISIYENRPKIGAVGAMVKPEIEGKAPEWFDGHSSVYACGQQMDRSGYATAKGVLFGAGLSFRTEVLHSIYNEPVPLLLTGRTKNSTLRGDDSELCLRTVLRGWQLWYDDSLVVYHTITAKRLKWEYVLNARRGGGKAAIYLLLYEYLLQNKQILTYTELGRVIKSKWRKFFMGLSSVASIYHEGSPNASYFSYLLGLSEEYSRIDSEFFDRTGRELAQHYKIPLESISDNKYQLKRIIKKMARVMGYEIIKT